MQYGQLTTISGSLCLTKTISSFSRRGIRIPYTESLNNEFHITSRWLQTKLYLANSELRTGIIHGKYILSNKTTLSA